MLVILLKTINLKLFPKVFCYATAIFLSAFFIAPKIVAAQVVINEVAWMGTKVETVESKDWWRYEWLELFNNADSPVSLNEWKLELYRDELDWTLKLDGIIPAKNYFLIVSSDKIFSDYDFNYSNLGGKFNNGGQKILLKNNLGEIVDNVDCFSPKKWFAGDNTTRQTMEKSEAGWQTSLEPGGTPGQANSVLTSSDATPSAAPSASPTATATASTASPTPAPGYQYSQKVLINEFLPWPESDGKEWVELVSLDGATINLSGWQIDDANASTSPQVLPADTAIAPGELLVVSFDKNALNNDRDKVRLLWPDDQVVHTVSYDKASQGQAVAKFDAGWLWTNQPTPGQANKKSLADNLANAPTIQQVASAEKITTTEESVNAPVKIMQSTPAPKSGTTAPPTTTALSRANATNPNLLATASEGGATAKIASGVNSVVALTSILFLAALSAFGLVYFKRQKQVDIGEVDD